MRLKKFINEEFEVPHMSGKSTIKTNVRPEERSFKNLPKDGKGKSKCRFQDWLEIKPQKAQSSHCACSIGKAANDKWYGWSHRAVYGFKAGDEVKPGTIGYKGNGKDSYTLKNDQEAKQQAIRFADEVS